MEFRTVFFVVSPQLTIIAAVYLLLMNLWGFASMGLDKQRARRGKWRVPEKTLFLVALLGGSLGSTVGMHVFHHKTKLWYFRYGLPAIFLAQAAVAVWLYFR